MSGGASRRLPVVILVCATGAVGCATRGVITPQPFPRPGAPDATPAAAARTIPQPADTYAITSTALSLRGVPYRDGGNSPSGFDCSGFTHYVYGQHGVALPRLATDQFDVGTDVSRSELEPGDLVFFTTTAAGPSHVGMALGGDEFVHAPSRRGEVRVERLSARYWAQRWIGAKRVVEH